jgi:hypothetical protein
VTELRRLRLARGWEPVQLIGRMKILAARDGVNLPAVYLLVRLLFLWENRRAELPGYYAGLLTRIYALSETTLSGNTPWEAGLTLPSSTSMYQRAHQGSSDQGSTERALMLPPSPTNSHRRMFHLVGGAR